MKHLLPMTLALAALATALSPGVVRADVDEAVLKAEADRVAAIKKAVPAYLAIFADGGQGGGSGVIISPDGYALSNFHVTKPAGTGMKVGMPDGKLYDAVIVGLDPTGDVGLIKMLGREDFPYAEIGNSDDVRIGDWCFAVGNPFLLATDFQPTITYGVVSGTHRYQYPDGTLLEYADCIQCDAAINPGNSGGPLFNARGQLIGINGRGSFEKRGRVNVGVGYAISINQIENFLGSLKSGRIVDHATTGFRVGTSDEGRVVVTDILEDSDAYRRGLRYDDEIVTFAGRPIRSANAFKNILGIFPKGWRIALTYRRDGKTHDTLVRLRGVHRTAELIAKVEGRDPSEPEPKPKKKPDDKKPDDKKPDDSKPGDAPKPSDIPKMIREHMQRATLPAIVKANFEAKTGYANYYFNKLNQQRLAKALASHGDFSPVAGPWMISGKAADNSPLQIVLGEKEASIVLPVGEFKLTIGDDLDPVQTPPGSGGLLAVLHLWRKMLLQGPTKFGDVYYLGTAPLLGRTELADVLVTTQAGVQCNFLIDPVQGQLLGLEMYPDDETDPCEVYFGSYQEHEGRLLPAQMEVRFGDTTFGKFTLDKYDLERSIQK